ncbi:hypothetical protein DN752_20605 [Echinicola strongylocentroti]|uniref:Big-1 domain-containing protein n=1 Tax=Echinicola strongylocentroti TaxID=1795355 RepID=A0A2Z4INJ9_9BACT|nr:hypothetical protein [Echinicola strongylocentroti]AWW32347.1 hypothetical protein DN752_20605 [Echinicola strongylocentroti]
MKNKTYKIWAVLLACLPLLFSCEDAVELATPNVASPVLVVVDGGAFPSDSEVTVTAKFMELDKTGILDNTVGIDSIPVSDLEVTVFINQTEEVSTVVTDGGGEAGLSVSWAALGLEVPGSGDQVRLEFAGTHDNIAFRKYHTVRVE